MSLEEGLIKYLIYTPLTIVGACSMYVYGGFIITIFATLHHLFSGDYIEAFIEYFLTNALPPTLIGEIILQIIVGTFAAGIKWYIAMSLFSR